MFEDINEKNPGYIEYLDKLVEMLNVCNRTNKNFPIKFVKGNLPNDENDENGQWFPMDYQAGIYIVRSDMDESLINNPTSAEFQKQATFLIPAAKSTYELRYCYVDGVYHPELKDDDRHVCFFADEIYNYCDDNIDEIVAKMCPEVDDVTKRYDPNRTSVRRSTMPRKQSSNGALDLPDFLRDDNDSFDFDK